jgi:hypothetical protein
MLYVGMILVFLGAFVPRHNVLVSIQNGKAQATGSGQSKMLITGVDSIGLAVGFGILPWDRLPLVLLVASLIALGIAPPCTHYSAYDFSKKKFGKE